MPDTLAFLFEIWFSTPNKEQDEVVRQCGQILGQITGRYQSFFNLDYFCSIFVKRAKGGVNVEKIKKKITLKSINWVYVGFRKVALSYLEKLSRQLTIL